jgi:hypothetical protein
MLKAYVYFCGYFVDFWIFFEQLDERFNCMCKIHFEVIVDRRVRVAFDSYVVSRTVFERGVLRIEMSWIRIELKTLAKLMLLLDYFDKSPYFGLNCASPRNKILFSVAHN